MASLTSSRDGGVDAGLGPWIPRLEPDKLYGRGVADDGYGMFGGLSALLARKRARGGACPLHNFNR